MNTTPLATLDDLASRLGGFFKQLYGDDMAAARDDLAAAVASVEGYVGGRYKLPLQPSESLKNYVLTLAEELAWRLDAAGSGETPKNVADRVAGVRRELERIADGKGVLPGQLESVENPVAGAIFAVTEEPNFTRDELAGY